MRVFVPIEVFLTFFQNWSLLSDKKPSLFQFTDMAPAVDEGTLSQSSAERCVTWLLAERTDVSLKYLAGPDTALLQLHSVITSSAISGLVNFP